MIRTLRRGNEGQQSGDPGKPMCSSSLKAVNWRIPFYSGRLVFMFFLLGLNWMCPICIMESKL